MLPLAPHVLVLAFVASGPDVSWGEATTAAVIDELSRDFIVKTAGEPEAPGFIVSGVVESIHGGVQVTVDVVSTEPRRKFGRTTVVVDTFDQAPAAARAAVRKLLLDPVGGFTPALTTGVLVVLGGAVATTVGAAGLFWNKEVLTSPLSSAQERARASSLELPFAIVAGAGALGVLGGAGIIVGDALLRE